MAFFNKNNRTKLGIIILLIIVFSLGISPLISIFNSLIGNQVNQYQNNLENNNSSEASSYENIPPITINDNLGIRYERDIQSEDFGFRLLGNKNEDPSRDIKFSLYEGTSSIVILSLNEDNEDTEKSLTPLDNLNQFSYSITLEQDNNITFIDSEPIPVPEDLEEFESLFTIGITPNRFSLLVLKGRVTLSLASRDIQPNFISIPSITVNQGEVISLNRNIGSGFTIEELSKYNSERFFNAIIDKEQITGQVDLTDILRINNEIIPICKDGEFNLDISDIDNNESIILNIQKLNGDEFQRVIKKD